MADRPVKDLTKDPCMTVAMGMKQTAVSVACWRAAISKEQRLREEWIRTYMPELERRERDIVERFKAKEEAKKNAPPTPERSLLFDGVSKDGKGRIAYLKARRELPPQERFGGQLPTASMELGSRKPEPPVRIEGLPSYGRKPVIKNGFFRRTIGGSLASP